MAPINVAIVGLSATSTTAWAASVHLPYLLSARGKRRFTLIALCNSSLKAAYRAIETYNLPPSTKAYGSPLDLAADPDVELVICSTRVDRHFAICMPCIQAGKDVFIEYPMAANAGEARELAEAARVAGVRTIVGLQGWFTPPIIELREIIASGRIGRVLSSEVRAVGWHFPITPNMEYFTERKIGGNFVTIAFGHAFDWIQHALGEIQNMQSRLQLQKPMIDIVDEDTGNVIDTVLSDVPDLIYVTGTLPETEHIFRDAALHMRFRSARTFKDEPALVWSVVGENAEIRLTATSNFMLQVSDLRDVTMEIYEHESEEVERVDLQWTGYPKLDYLPRIYSFLYEYFAAGCVGKYPDVAHAAKRHAQLDGLLAAWDASKGE